MRLGKGAADSRHMQRHTGMKNCDSWRSAGPCVRPESSQLGNWCEPRDRLWLIQAESVVTCQGVWICSGGVGVSYQRLKWQSDSHVSSVDE